MKEIGTKVKNERLGVSGRIIGFCMEPSFSIEDENGKEWIGGINSPFFEEWKEVKEE